MNKVYRTVWNQTTNTWVAVQETAKAHSKSGGSKAGVVGNQVAGVHFAFTFVASALLLASGQVMAASGNQYPLPAPGNGNYCYYDTASQSVVCGDTNANTVNNVAGGATAKSVVVGHGATNAGESNVAIGVNTSSAGTAAIAMGASAKADANQAIAMGLNAEATTAWDISIGRRAGQGITKADSGEGRNIAIGDGALQNAVKPNNNIALGTSSAAGSTGTANVVIGTYANSTTAQASGVNASNVVAIGDRALATTNSAIGIGNRVKASGAIATAVGASSEASGAYSIANGYGAAASGSHSIAIGSSQNLANKTQATQNFAIAVGAQSKAQGAQAVATGYQAQALTENSIAIGNDAQAKNNTGTIAIGKSTQATGTSSVALGTNSQSTAQSTVAVGNSAKAQNTNAVAIGDSAQAAGTGNVAIGQAAGRLQAGAVTGNNTVVVGVLAGADSANNQGQVALGWEAGRNSTGTFNVASGYQAGQYVNGNSNIAIGNKAGQGVSGALLSVNDTVALGSSATVKANNAIAIGKGAQATAEDSISIGTGSIVSGQGSGAFGDPNTVSGAGSYAFGNNNTIAQNNTFVLGNSVTTTQANSVTLGNASADRAATTVGNATVGGITYGTFAGQGSAANGVVSVGAASKERQIINVAAGEISATSTDAINGSQLHATQVAIGKVAGSTATHLGGGAAVQADGSISAPTYTINGTNYNNVGAALQAAAASGGGGVGTHYYSVRSGQTAAGSNYNNDGATGSDSLAAGVKAKATQRNAVAVGSDAYAYGSESLAIGNNVIAAPLKAKANPTDPDEIDEASALNVVGATAVGNNSRATAVGAQAFGQSSRATAENAAAVGRLATASGTRASAFGVGNTASGASSFSGGDRTVAAGKGAVAIGAWGDASDPLGNKATQTDAAYSVVIGAAAQANQHSDSAVVIGNQASAAGASAASTAKDSVAIGYRSAVTTASNIALGSNAKADGNSQATAIGYMSNAKGYQSIAFGSGASAAQTAGGSVALGRETKTTAGNAVAIGNKSEANVGDSVALGSGAATLSSGVGSAPSGSVAIGRGAQTTDRGYALGINARATNESIAIGTNTNYDPATTSAKTIGLSSVAIGNNTNAAGENTVALGNQSTATGSKATAFGFNTGAQGQSSVVIGDSAKNTFATTPGSRAGDQVVAVGTTANASALGSVALGSTTTTTGVYGTALGIGATNNTNFGVALGALSTTDNTIQVDRAGYAPVASAQAAIDATKANAAGVSVGGTVANTWGNDPGETALRPNADGSIKDYTTGATGTFTIRRQIHNVAAGTDDTDAVNVAQLKALSAATTAAKTHYYSVKDDAADAATPNSNYNNDGATGVRSLAAGIWSQATAENATAIGGKNARATAVQALAVGADTLAEGTSSIAIGGDDLDHLKSASSATYTALTGDTITVGNYKVTYAKGDAAIAVGVQTEATGDLSMALGTKAETSSVAAVALGTGAKGQAEGAVALGAGSVADRAALAGVTTNPVASAAANQVYAPDAAQAAEKAAVVATVKGQQGAVSVGNANTTRQITNVAAGSENTDAVNVAQLKAVAARTETTPLTVTNGEVTAPVAGSADANKLATAGDIANAINNSGFKLTAGGANPSLVTPGDTVDLAGDANILVSKGANSNNVGFKLADTVKIGPSTGGNPITINGTAGTISGLNGNLPVPAATAQAAPSPLPAAGNAATVGDVLNAGWNLQTNGTATDFVRPYDTVNFVGGNGTTVSSTTDGATTTIKVDVNAQGLAESAQLPVVYTKADGSKVYKHTDGNFYSAPNGGGAQVPVADVIASMQNANGSTTAPTTLANVRAGAKDTDAVNVSQLKGAAAALGGGAGIDPTTGAFAAPSYTINKTDGTSYPAANNVGQALQNLNAEVVKPLTFAGDSGTNVERKLGSTVNIKGGAAATATLTDGNIGVVANGTDTLTVKLAENINLGSTGSVKTGNTTVNNGGVTIANTDPAKVVSLSGNGLNNGGNKITGVANGVDPNDAVNMSQLTAMGNAAKTHYYSVNSSTTGVNSNYDNDGATGTNALAAGVSASATGISATAVGHGAKAGADYTVAVGLNAQATASGAMAQGNGAQAAGVDSVAHGKDSHATGNYATAVGNSASAGLHAAAVGNGATASGNYATAFGTGSQASGGGAAALGNDAKASQWAAVAVGRDAQASQTAAVAIGEGARAAHEGSVALGSGSATTVVDNTGRSSATVGGITYSGFAADAPTSMVSVGRDAGVDAQGQPIPEINRTITHVAAGRINATSTDAINGSQLHATQTVIGNVAGSVKDIFGGNAAVGADGKLSMTNIGGTGKGNIHDAIAAINSTAGAGWNIGNGTAAVGAVKPGKQVDFVAGNGSTKVDVTHDAGTGNSKVTVSAAPGALQYTGTNNPNGANTPNADQFTPTNSVTLVGTAGNTGGVTINNVAPAVLSNVSKQAVNGSQLYNTGSSTAAALGGTSSFDLSTGKVTAGLAVGGTTHASVQDALNAINTTASAGWNLKANGGTASNIAPNGTVDVVNGSNTKVTLTGNTLKVDVVDAPTFSGEVKANGGLTVGSNLKAAAGTNVDMGGNVVHNVADGVAGTDAVNVRQLNAALGGLAGTNNANINALDAKVNDVANTANAGVAQAIATAGLPQAYLPGKNMVAVGGGYYKGETGYAIGFSTISDSGNWIIKATGSGNSRGNFGASIGAGYQW